MLIHALAEHHYARLCFQIIQNGRLGSFCKVVGFHSKDECPQVCENVTQPDLIEANLTWYNQLALMNE